MREREPGVGLFATSLATPPRQAVAKQLSVWDALSVIIWNILYIFKENNMCQHCKCNKYIMYF